jgi:predicted enzyme related to lactoylglutathione lyase
MSKSQSLSHVAMSVPAGTLTDEYRSRVLEFYGRVFGWNEMESLRRPDRMTIAVGANYINVRERDDAATYTGYEHFGVSFPTADEIRATWQRAKAESADVTLGPLEASAGGFLTFRLRYLLPLTVEAQYFPRPA